MSDNGQGYDDLVRRTAVGILRGRDKAVDRRILLRAVNLRLGMHLGQKEFMRICKPVLSAEHPRDQRGRALNLTLDLPERVALRRAFKAAAPAQED